jgi:UDP-N-acetylmuramoylalanine--D-glutamate ligase
MSKEPFSGKIVLVMGLGRFGGGVDTAKFLAEAGAKVIVTDLAGRKQLSDSINKLKEFPDIEYHLSSHNEDDFLQADIIVANPAVPPDNKFLQLARRHKKSITSQIGIFFQLCPATIIGITGANGKSTTAALTAHLLKSAGDEQRAKPAPSEVEGSDEHVWLSGNIGNEPLLTILNDIKANDLVVLEISSFQIEQLAEIQKAPKIALLTNLTPNHLDRYGTFENYCAAKENIFKLQQLDRNDPATSIFNAEDEIAAEWFEKYKCDAGRTCIKFSTSDVSRNIRDYFSLPGKANLSNLAAAISIAKYFGVDNDQIKKALPSFKSLPHRLEFVAEKRGVRWFNDSKATTPLSAITALEAFDQPIILIAGGYDKHLPFDEFGQKIAEKAKAAILIGQTASKIADAIRNTISKQGTRIENVKSLDEAVQSARRLAEPGDVVLLSPACASYDMFENFEQRGREFIRLVQELGD